MLVVELLRLIPTGTQINVAALYCGHRRGHTSVNVTQKSLKDFSVICVLGVSKALSKCILCY